MVGKDNPSLEGFKVTKSEVASTNLMAAHKQVGMNSPREERVRVEVVDKVSADKEIPRVKGSRVAGLAKASTITRKVDTGLNSASEEVTQYEVPSRDKLVEQDMSPADCLGRRDKEVEQVRPPDNFMDTEELTQHEVPRWDKFVEQLRPPDTGVGQGKEDLRRPEGGPGHDEDLRDVRENMMVTQQQAEGKRGDTVRVRNKAKWKLVKERPSRLQPLPRKSQLEDSDTDDDRFSGLRQ